MNAQTTPAKSVKDILSAYSIPAELKSKAWSDVYFEKDGEKYYFVDLVMEGGGMLGLGLVGYTYVLEQCNIRFRKIAGTSAGAINAIGLSAAGTPDQSKTMAIADVLDEVAFFSFVDGPKAVRDVVQNPGGGNMFSKGWRWMKGVISGYKRLKAKRGLNPGQTFYDWMERKVLKPFGAAHLTGLASKWTLPETVTLNHPPRFTYDKSAPFGGLAVKASCMAVGVEVTFPKDADLFYRPENDAPVADFARASMSIPIFFDPFTLTDIPPYSDVKDRLQRDFSVMLKDPQKYGESVSFVDGGLLSNFPFDEFHAKPSKVPSMPTFGAKLGFDVDRFDNSSLLNFISNVVDIAKGNTDKEYRHEHFEDYNRVVKEIDTTDIGWLDFDMSPEDKEKLIVNGCDAAVAFLKSFDWEEYRAFRQKNAAELIASITGKPPEAEPESPEPAIPA